MLTAYQHNLGDEFTERTTNEVFTVTATRYGYSDLGHNYDLYCLNTGVWVTKLSQTDLLTRFDRTRISEHKPFFKAKVGSPYPYLFDKVIYRLNYDDSGRVYDVAAVAYVPVSATEFEYTYTLMPPKNALYHEYQDGQFEVSEAKLRGLGQVLEPFEQDPIKPKLWTERSGYEISDSNFDDLICKVYHFDEFSCVANEEWGNDSEHTFSPGDLVLTADDRARLAEFMHTGGVKPQYITSTLMIDLVRREVIPDGNWVISVSW